MKAIYPNLDLLEYKAKQLLSADPEFIKTLDEAKSNQKYASLDFNTIVFPQIWGSTCTGFDEAADGSPTISGSAMTKEYTTVMCEIVTGSYVIFFGNKPCYKVTNPNEDFLTDLKNHNMAGLSEAKRRY